MNGTIFTSLCKEKSFQPKDYLKAITSSTLVSVKKLFRKDADGDVKFQM
jgi:hypothetical protein